LEHALEIYWNKPRAINTLKYVTAQYSSFEFLMGLGIHFSETHDLIKYNVKDIFNILFTFAKKAYPDDHILQQLIALDYCAFEKVRPAADFINELPRTERFNLLDSNKLNHNKFRFVVMPISFDFDIFKAENRIEHCEQIIIWQYDGVTKSKEVKIRVAEEIY
jgi:anaerobic magnesium-protoporphyrin IX monomethyl ester cyclase